jgi:hypothetical protein
MRLALLGGAGMLLAGCAGASRTSGRALSPAWPEAPSVADGRTRRRVPLEIDRPAPAPSWDRGPLIRGEVIPRTRWTRAQPIQSRMNPPLRVVRRVTIHHDGMRPVTLRSSRDVADRIEAIRSAHINQGWGDIGYHYIVDPLGQVWEGRPVRYQGAHVRGQNDDNVGILVLGNFERQTPTDAQVAALDRFAVAQLRVHRISPRRLYTHQELAPTACPGRSLQAYIDHSRRRGGAIARA